MFHRYFSIVTIENNTDITSMEHYDSQFMAEETFRKLQTSGHEPIFVQHGSLKERAMMKTFLDKETRHALHEQGWLV